METTAIKTVQTTFDILHKNQDQNKYFFLNKLAEYDTDFQNKNQLGINAIENFTTSITRIVKHLHNPQKLAAILSGLRSQFSQIELNPTFFDFAGTALIATIANTLKEKFTLEVELAWFKIYATITQNIKPV